MHFFNHITASSTVFDVAVPGVGAVFVEYVELSRRDEFAAVDSRLNCSETSKNAHLFDIADDRRDVEALQFRVDGVQAADEVLQKKLESLRQADQLSTLNLLDRRTNKQKRLKCLKRQSHCAGTTRVKVTGRTA